MTNRTHVIGIVLSFICGILVLPVLLFWGAGWTWALVVSLPCALVLATLRHRRPHLFDGYVGDPDPAVIAAQEHARSQLTTTAIGTYL